MTRCLIAAMTCLLATVAAAAQEPQTPNRYPPLAVEGGFENAQLHGVSITDAGGPTPTVVIGGEFKNKPNQALAYRNPHKYTHWHLRLKNIAGRVVRLRYGPTLGEPQVQSLKAPVVYYDPAARRYELMHDIRLVKVFLGSADADRSDKSLWATVLEAAHRFRADTAYVALTFPLTNADLADLSHDLASRPHAAVNETGRSRFEGIPIRQFVVTDASVPEAGKQGVWLYGGEDPWEFPGMIACAAAARWAASDDPLAAQFRKRFVLSCIPIVHPDCVRRGQTNYALTDDYSSFTNFSRGWGRKDIPEQDCVREALRKWKDAGRSIDYGESMHSSLSWGSFLRLDWGDATIGKRYVADFIQARYMPWYGYQTAGAQYADVAESTGFASALRRLYPQARFYASHTEQILFPLSKLPGLTVPAFPDWGKADWTDEDTRNMRGQMAPHRVPDIEAWGVYRLLALMEMAGEKLDPAALPPQLICGDVDGYASTDGQVRTFTVIYRDVLGREPKQVALYLAGDDSRRAMQRGQGTSPLHGIRFTAQVATSKGAPRDFHFTADNGQTQVRYPPTGEFLGPYVAGK